MFFFIRITLNPFWVESLWEYKTTTSSIFSVSLHNTTASLLWPLSTHFTVAIHFTGGSRQSKGICLQLLFAKQYTYHISEVNSVVLSALKTTEDDTCDTACSMFIYLFFYSESDSINQSVLMIQSS